jgi:hypothetical protein
MRGCPAAIGPLLQLPAKDPAVERREIDGIGAVDHDQIELRLGRHGFAHEDAGYVVRYFCPSPCRAHARWKVASVPRIAQT